jgi:PTH1 family peptidyl-tRNA hydrolase
MKLIVGLGNPGKKYALTRHNTGFIFVDLLAQKYGQDWQDSKKLHSQIAKPSKDLVLAKPQTFMNTSGKAVKALVNFYKVDIDNLLVVHDDLDIKLGEYKVTHKSPLLHNGVNSIENELNSNEFTRLRLGIENRAENIPGEKYVLENFTPNEIVVINNTITKLINEKF